MEELNKRIKIFKIARLVLLGILIAGLVMGFFNVCINKISLVNSGIELEYDASLIEIIKINYINFSIFAIRTWLLIYSTVMLGGNFIISNVESKDSKVFKKKFITEILMVFEFILGIVISVLLGGIGEDGSISMN